MQISLAKIFALIFTIGLLSGLFTYPSAEELKWSSGPLFYATPKIPASFSDDRLPVPNWNRWVPDEHAIKLGTDLYSINHRAGWRFCENRFIDNESWHDIPSVYQLPESFDPNDAWSPTHLEFAARDGYMNCIDELEKLLQSRNVQQLRLSLKQKAWWHPIPRVAMMTALLVTVSYLTMPIIRRITMR